MAGLLLWVALLLVWGQSLAIAGRVITTSQQFLQSYGLGGVAEPGVGSDGFKAASFSPDNKRILTWGRSGAYLWDAATGKLIRSYRGHGDEIQSAVFSADGNQVVTSSKDGSARIWDTKTGRQLSIFQDSSPIVGARLSPDGRRLLTGGFAKLWDVKSGLVITSLTSASGQCPVFSKDGALMSLAQHSNDPVQIWDGSDGRLLRTLDRPADEVAFSYDGSLLLTRLDEEVRLYDAGTGSLFRTFTYPNGNLKTMELSRDRALLITAGSGHDSNVVLWNVATGQIDRTLPIHTTVLATALSPNGTDLLIGATNSSPTFWNARTGLQQFSLQGFTRGLASSDVVASLSFSNDTREAVFATRKGVVRVFDATTGAILSEELGHKSAAFASSFSKKGKFILTGNSNQSATLWDSSSGRVVEEFTKGEGEGESHSAVFSPDGDTVLMSDDTTQAALYDVRSGTVLARFGDDTQTSVVAACFSRDGRLVLTGNRADLPSVKLWDAGTGERLGQVDLTDVPSTVEFSPDDTRILISTDREVQIRKLSDGSLEHSFTLFLPPDIKPEASYSPDGQHIMVVDDYVARVYNVESETLEHEFAYFGIGASPGKVGPENKGSDLGPFTAFIQSAAFSPDGKEVVTGGYVNGGFEVRVWDVATETPLKQFRSHIDNVSSVEFSADGNQLLSSAEDGRTLIYDLRPSRAVIIAGGGNYPGNGIANQTRDLADYAFRLLKARGYANEDIQYLTPFAPGDSDGDGLDDADAYSSKANIENVMTGAFAKESGKLLVLMIDHGHTVGNFMGFRANPFQVLSTARFKNWLNGLQSDNPVDVALVVDCCYSGRFVDDLGPAPAGRERLLISSTTSNAVSVFLPPPDLTSFMHIFLNSAYMGNSFGEAFRACQSFFQLFPVGGQMPQIQDGTGDSSVADHVYLGAEWGYGVQSQEDSNDFFPVFKSVMPPVASALNQPVTLTATTLAGEDPTTVIATLRKPAPSVVSGDPVTTLAGFVMTRQSEDPEDPGYRVWEAVAPGELFHQKGVYKVTFTPRFPTQQVGKAAVSTITVDDGSDPDETTITAVLAVGSSPVSEINTALGTVARYAYDTFLTRFQDVHGVKHPEWIDYFSPHSDPQRIPNSSTVSGVLNAINGTAPQVGRLYVHLAGDAAVSGTVNLASGEVLSATQLDAALDALQSRQTCEVVLSVDAPRSGAFLATCQATGNQSRVVFTSSGADDPALFLAVPPVSFTHKFLGAARMGLTLLDAFESARSFFHFFVGPSAGEGSIEPQLDDDASSAYDEFDGAVAGTLYLGKSFAFAGDDSGGLPFILDVTAPQTAAPGETTTFTAILMDGLDPIRVYADIIPSSTLWSSSDSLTTFPQIEFTRDGAGPDDWSWSAGVTAPPNPADFTLVVYAEYLDASGGQRLSDPAFTALTVAIPADSPDGWEPAPFLDSASATSANYILEGDSQVHTLHTAADEDWGIVTVAAFDLEGTSISLPFSLKFSDIQSTPGATILVELYENGPNAPRTYFHSVVNGTNATWSASGLDRLYYRVRRTDSVGSGVRYRMRVDKNTGDNNGIISQIGSNRVSIGWPTAGPSPVPPGSKSASAPLATLLGYSINRLESWTGNTVNLTPTLIPPAVGCPCPAAVPVPPGSMCQEFLDTIPVPVPPPGSNVPFLVRYDVYAVYSNATQALVTSQFAAVYFNGGASGNGFCPNSGISDWRKQEAGSAP